MSENVLFQTTAASAAGSVTSLTIAVTSNPAGAGNKKIIVVTALIRGSASTVARTFVNVEFAGATLNSDAQATNTASLATRVGVFSANLSGTSTGNVLIEASGTCRIIAAVLIVDGLDQSTAAVLATSTSLASLGVDVAGLAIAGIANVANGTAAADYAITATAGQSLATGSPIVTSDGATTENNFAAGYRTAGSGSQAFAWSSPNARATHVVVGYPRVATGGGSTPAPTSLSTSGTSTDGFGMRAVAQAALASSGSSLVQIGPLARARAILASAGTSILTFGARAAAGTALQSAGVAIIAVAARARGFVRLASEGSSAITFATGAGFVRSAARTLFIGREDRRLSIEREDRELRVAAENRRLEIEP